MMNLEDVNLLNSSSTAEKKTKVKNIPITSADSSSSSMNDPKVASSSASEVAARTVNAVVGPIIKFHDHDDANGANDNHYQSTTKRSSGLLVTSTATTGPKRSSRTLKRQEWFTQRAEEDYERRFDIQNKYSIFEKQSSERGLLLGFGGGGSGGAAGGGSGGGVVTSNGKHYKRVGSKSRTSTTTTTSTSPYTGASMRSVTSTHSAPSPSTAASSTSTHINNNSNILKTPRSVGGLFKRNRISSGSNAGGTTSSSTNGVTTATPLTSTTRGRFGIRGGTHASTQTSSTIQSNDSRNTSSSHGGAIPPPPFFSSTSSTGGDALNANATPQGFMSLPHRRQVSSDSFDHVLGNDDAAEPPDTLPFTSTTHSNAAERGNRQRRRNATHSSPTNQTNRSILTSSTTTGSPILPLDTTKPRRLRSVAKQFGTKILGQIATVVQATSDGMEGIISFYQGAAGDRNGLLNKRRSVALRKRKQEPPALILSDLTRPLEDFALYTKAQLIADDTIEFRKLQQALRERRRLLRHQQRCREDENHHKKRHPRQGGRVSEKHKHYQNDNDIMRGIMMPVTDMGVRYCLHDLKMLDVGCQTKRHVKLEKLRQEELKRQREERQKQLEDQRRNILLQQRALAQSQMQQQQHQGNLDCPTTPTTLRRHLTAPYSPSSTNRSAAHTVAAVVADAVGQSTRNLFGSSRKDNNRSGAGAGCGDLMEDFSHPRCRPIPSSEDDDDDDLSSSSPPMTPPISTRKQQGSSSSSARRLATSPRLETYEAAAAAAYEAAVEDDSKGDDLGTLTPSRSTTRRVATPPDSSTTLEAAAQAVYAAADDDEHGLALNNDANDSEKDDQADMLAAMERQNHQNCNDTNFLNVKGDTSAIPKWRTRRNTQKNLKHMQRIPSPSPPTSPEGVEQHSRQKQLHRRELPQLRTDDENDDNLSHLSSDGSCLEVDFSPQIRKERALLAQGQRGGKKFQVQRHISEGKAYVDGLGSPQPTISAGHEGPPSLPLPPFVSSASHTTATPLKDNVSRNVAATSTQPAPPLSPLRDHNNNQTQAAVPLSPSYSSSHISDTDTSASGAARRSSSIDSLRSLGSANPSGSTTSSPTRQSRRLRKSKRPPSSSQAKGAGGVAPSTATTSTATSAASSLDTSKHTTATAATKPTSFDPHAVGQLDVEFGHRSMPLEHIHTTATSNNHPNNVAADATTSSSHHHRMHHSMPLSLNDSVIPLDQNSLSFPTTEDKSRPQLNTVGSNSHHHHHLSHGSSSSRHHYHSHRRTTGHHHSNRTSELSDCLHQHSSLDARRRRHTGNHVLHTTTTGNSFDRNTSSMASSGELATATNTASTTTILNK